MLMGKLTLNLTNVSAESTATVGIIVALYELLLPHVMRLPVTLKFLHETPRLTPQKNYELDCITDNTLQLAPGTVLGTTSHASSPP